MRRLLLSLATAAAAHASVVHMFIGYGQSLSLGNWGCPAISTTQPYSNKRLNVGNSALVALIEDGTCVGATNLGATQESPNSSVANNLTLLDPAHAIVSLINNYGSAGTPISGLQKGTGPYTNAIAAVTAANTLVTGAGNTLVVHGLIFTEGESDFVAASTTYVADNLQLRSDFDTDIKAITGQTEDIKVFYSQLSSNESSPGASNIFVCPDTTTACLDDPAGTAAPMVTIAQWVLQRDYRRWFFMTGPKYQYTYGDGGFHMDSVSYNKLGASVARTLATLIINGSSSAYAGVFPSTISRSGTTVTVTAVAPNSLTLALDTTTVPNPYRNGAYDTHGAGFQFFCNNGGTVTEIAFTGTPTVSGNTITLTLASTPSCSTQERVAYAFEGERYAATPIAGCSPDATTCNINATPTSVFPTRGTAHGNIRTAADYTDVNGDSVYHWMNTFNEPVGFNWNPAGGSIVGGKTIIGGKVTVQ